MKVPISVEFTVVDDTTGRPNPVGLEDHLDLVQDELMILDNITDPVISATLSTGQVEIELWAEGQDELEAMQKGLAAMRTAIHAAGGATPTWHMHPSRVRVGDQNDEGLLAV